MLMQQAPKVPDFRFDWAYSSLNLGICYRLMGRSRAADRMIDAINAWKDLEKTYPKYALYRQKQALGYCELGILLAQQKDLAPRR